MAPKRAVMMHPQDNVATTVESVKAGEEVAIPATGAPLVLQAREEIPFGFKIALADIPQGEIIRKYGATIGRASAAIAKGTLVHIHNLEGTRARGDLEGRTKR